MQHFSACRHRRVPGVRFPFVVDSPPNMWWILEKRLLGTERRYQADALIFFMHQAFSLLLLLLDRQQMMERAQEGLSYSFWLSPPTLFPIKLPSFVINLPCSSSSKRTYILHQVLYRRRIFLLLLLYTAEHSALEKWNVFDCVLVLFPVGLFVDGR